MITPAFQPTAQPVNHPQRPSVPQNTVQEVEAPYRASSSGQIETQLLRDQLSRAETPDNIRHAIDLFLKEPERTTASQFSVLVDRMRSGDHRLQEQIDKLHTAIEELNFAISTYEQQDLIAGGTQIVRELQTRIDVLEQKIEEEIESRMLKGMTQHMSV